MWTLVNLTPRSFPNLSIVLLALLKDLTKMLFVFCLFCFFVLGPLSEARKMV